MLARLMTYSLLGIDAVAIDVEVDISPGALPKTTLVGLAEAAVRESTHRIERALVNSGYQRPVDHTVINLSPADLPKDAASFDLPIALGMLVASGQLESDLLQEFDAVGELALDGSLRPVKGVLSMALSCRQKGRRGLIVPAANVQEAAVVEGIQVIPAGSLTEAAGFLTGHLTIEPAPFSWTKAQQEYGQYTVDYADVKGQKVPSERSWSLLPAGTICS